MAKTCKYENCNNPIFGKGCCKFHYPKSTLKKKNIPLKKSYLSKKPTEKTLAKKEEKKMWLEELHNWELKLWDKTQWYSNSHGQSGQWCKECKKWLSSEHYKKNLCCYSHLISKSSRKDLAMIEENIAIVCPDCHANFESNPNNTPVQKQLRDKMIEKYGK